jgi:ABC-type amino acid transport substrate-binding protein
MVRATLLALCILAASAASPSLRGSQPADEQERLQSTAHKKPNITLAVDVDFPPYAFYNVGEAGISGGLTGFGKDFGEGMGEACGLGITFVQTNWNNCWDPDGYKPGSPGIGKGLLNHWFDGCSTYTHVQGVRNRFAEFTNSILDSNKPAGLLTLLRKDGTPNVDGLDDLAGRRVVDVAGWAPTADGLTYVENKCTGKNYAPMCVDSGDDADCYTLLVGDGNDAAMKMLRNGEADAMFIYADQAYNFQCTADGKTHSGAAPTWDCDLWKGFGTEYAYVQTGQFGHVINGTTLALAPKGSGLAELLNPCIQSFLKTKAYYDLCVKYDLVETCYTNEFFPPANETLQPYLLPTDEQSTGCHDGYCSCPSGFNSTDSL